ncbi:MAG TPA: FG-GAP-like repeat-containing protein [Phycisphaerae bacterium]|nr:FG-GAP-like repeat-containing protein [Phycisphaerae bacterium]
MAHKHSKLFCGLMTILGSLSLSTETQAGTLTFSNQTAASGINVTHAVPVGAPYPPMVGGGAVGDFNNDGWQDLFVLSGGTQPDKLYINNGNGTFTDQAAAWGVNVVHQGAGASVGDYDGNGYLDIYVTSYCPAGQSPGPGNHRLYRNNGDGTFTEVAAAAGVNLAAPIADGFGSAFGDYDLDGDLDLAMTGWAYQVGGNRLFINNGDGTFSNATADLNYDVTQMRGFSPRFADMDLDRYPELLFVADFNTSRYFVNKRDGTFEDQTAESHTGVDLAGMGTTVGDFNRDGYLDWFVTAVFFGSNTTTRGNMLYMNDNGKHRFMEVSEAANVSDGAWGWGTVAVDFDHDMLVDIGETNGWNPAPWTNQMNRLYMNNGDGTFTNNAAAAGFNFTGQGRGLVNFDYDNDGDQDVVVFPNFEAIRLYRNDLTGPDTNWLRIFLDTSDDPGLAPNGFGTRVIVTADGITQYGYLHGGCNFLSVSELSVHFGLGGATDADVRVEWSDGTITVLSSVSANQTLTIASGAARGPVGDLDGDGIVDPSDLERMTGCIKGPQGHIYTGCAPADWDSDGDADLADFAEYQLAIEVGP